MYMLEDINTQNCNFHYLFILVAFHYLFNLLKRLVSIMNWFSPDDLDWKPKHLRSVINGPLRQVRDGLTWFIGPRVPTFTSFDPISLSFWSNASYQPNKKHFLCDIILYSWTYFTKFLENKKVFLYYWFIKL